MRQDQVVLVDEQDNKIGLMDKLAAHKGAGTLHRAISILLYRTRIDRASGRHLQEVLLQRRSKNKLLWPLFWTNTVCTHPRDGESYEDCAVRRLKEEMGITADKKDLHFVDVLYYQAQYIPDLAEHELDSVFVGKWDGVPQPDHKEAHDWKWVKYASVIIDIQSSVQYTPWFKKLIVFQKVQELLSI